MILSIPGLRAAPCCSGSGPRAQRGSRDTYTWEIFFFLCLCVDGGFVLLGEIIYRREVPGEGGGWPGACLRGG